MHYNKEDFEHLENITECTSCDKKFELEDHNERPEGDFCDECLEQ